jgi:hypothetical protein
MASRARATRRRVKKLMIISRTRRRRTAAPINRVRRPRDAYACASEIHRAESFLKFSPQITASGHLTPALGSVARFFPLPGTDYSRSVRVTSREACGNGFSPAPTLPDRAFERRRLPFPRRFRGDPAPTVSDEKSRPKRGREPPAGAATPAPQGKQPTGEPKAPDDNPSKRTRGSFPGIRPGSLETVFASAGSLRPGRGRSGKGSPTFPLSPGQSFSVPRDIPEASAPAANPRKNPAAARVSILRDRSAKTSRVSEFPTKSRKCFEKPPGEKPRTRQAFPKTRGFFISSRGDRFAPKNPFDSAIVRAAPPTDGTRPAGDDSVSFRRRPTNPRHPPLENQNKAEPRPRGAARSISRTATRSGAIPTGSPARQSPPKKF